MAPMGCRASSTADSLVRVSVMGGGAAVSTLARAATGLRRLSRVSFPVVVPRWLTIAVHGTPSTWRAAVTLIRFSRARSRSVAVGARRYIRATASSRAISTAVRTRDRLIAACRLPRTRRGQGCEGWGRVPRERVRRIALGGVVRRAVRRCRASRSPDRSAMLGRLPRGLWLGVEDRARSPPRTLASRVAAPAGRRG